MLASGTEPATCSWVFSTVRVGGGEVCSEAASAPTASRLAVEAPFFTKISMAVPGVTNRNGGWQCAEVESETILGLGTYTFNVNSVVSNLDPNVVAGLFTWSNDPSHAHREIDFEFSRFGQPSRNYRKYRPYAGKV